MDNENENKNPEEKEEEKMPENTEEKTLKNSEEKPENEILVNDFRESKFKEPKKTLALKYKIIIIVAISLVIIGIVTAITLIVMKQKSSDDSDDDVEVLDPVVINPTSDYTHCLIFLHGYESSPEHYEPFFEDFYFKKKENTKIILMRAPYQIVSFNKENKTSWFDIITFPIDSTDSYNFTEATRSRKAVEKVIKKEAELLNGKYENIFIGGHSQGACVTLYTGYNMNELIGGVVAFSGVLFPEIEIVGDKNKLKVFLGHGFRDQAIPMTFHNETVKRIEKFEGVKKFYYEEMGHNIGDEEKRDAEGFLNNSMV